MIKQEKPVQTNNIQTPPTTPPKLQWSDWLIPIKLEIRRVSKLVSEVRLSPFHLQMTIALVLNIRSQLAASPCLPSMENGTVQSAILYIARANMNLYLVHVSKAAELIASGLHIILKIGDEVWPRYLQFLIYQLDSSVTDYVQIIENVQLAVQDDQYD
jgi:hypothetical protein